MEDDEKLLDSIKKVELGDLKILVVGIVLLAVPAFLLMFFLTQDSSDGLSKESLRRMSGRRSTFSFATNKRNASARSSSGSKAGWFSGSSPEKKAEIELESAMKSIKRGSINRVKRMSRSGNIRMQEYAASIDPSISLGNGLMDEGHYLEAAANFEEAFQRGDKNIFLKLNAISGLCEVYGRMQDQEKLEKAFQIYMDLVAKLPPDMGGGDLRKSVQGAFMMLKSLKNKSDLSKLSEGVSKSKLAKSQGISGLIVKSKMKDVIKYFPAKF